jgi:hypothetical protein
MGDRATEGGSKNLALPPCGGGSGWGVGNWEQNGDVASLRFCGALEKPLEKQLFCAVERN